MSNNTLISIEVVRGGFILSSASASAAARHCDTTEVFTSQGKLLKAVRGLLDGAVPDKNEEKQELTE